MAYMIPDSLLGNVSPETLKVFRLLKRLPEPYVIRHRFGLSAEPGPDYWILRSDRCSLFLSVSGTTSAELQQAAQPSLLDSLHPNNQHPRPPFGQILDGLAQFGKRIGLELPAMIVCPNLSASELDHHSPGRPHWIGMANKEYLHPDLFQAWLQDHLSQPLAEEAITQLRKILTPEVIIPPQFTVLTPVTRNTEAKLTEYLLDFDQEGVLKTDLDLNREGEAAARDLALHLVNGVAGRGKSLILIYRAHLLRQLYPEKRILVLTHNRPLSHDLESRYQRLHRNGQVTESTEWKTFLAWCHSKWPRQQPWCSPIGQSRRNELVRRAWQAQLQNTPVSERMLREEIDWYKDRLVFSRADYLAADRTGRGFALNEGLRNKVYDALEAYRSRAGPTAVDGLG